MVVKKINKTVVLGSIAASIGLSGCADMNDTFVITDDNGQPHRTIDYLRDKRGRNYFPVQAPSTGRKRFVFDPNAHAWAAYDAQGERVMTGGASGGKIIVKTWVSPAERLRELSAFITCVERSADLGSFL